MHRGGFRLGRCYAFKGEPDMSVPKRPNRKPVHICGLAGTHTCGAAFVGERTDGNIVLVNMAKGGAVGWEEITFEQWKDRVFET